MPRVRSVRRVVRAAVAGLALVAALVVLGSLGSSGAHRTDSHAGALSVVPAAVTNSPPPTVGTATTASTASGDAPRTATAGPDVVTVGFSIIDIRQIDLQHHRYQLYFSMWFRWSNPDIDPTTSFEFINGTDRWSTVRLPASDGPVRLADGSLYRREHIEATFTTNMPLEDYPHDRQALTIIMEDVDRTSDEMVFVLDDPAVATVADLTTPGYLVHEPTATVVDEVTPDLGETGKVATSASRVIVTIPLTRPWLPYTLKIFIPFAVVVLCAAIVFLISPAHVDARFGLGISSLLTLIALKWTTDGEMPLVDYLGLVDALYVVAFIFIAVGLAQTTSMAWRRNHGTDDATLERADRRVFTVALGLLVVGCAVVIAVFAA